MLLFLKPTLKSRCCTSHTIVALSSKGNAELRVDIDLHFFSKTHYILVIPSLEVIHIHVLLHYSNVYMFLV